jgi:ADP-ribose pyrophosphatase YjhB (NUDIX family)
MIHEGRVLLHRAEDSSQWSLPGGRAELLELTQETLRREIREETGQQAEVGDLLWVMEHFFEYQGRQFHELGFYYRASFRPGSPLLAQEEFYGYEPGLRLIYRWIPLDALGAESVLPEFLKKGLLNLPERLSHVQASSPPRDR